MKIATIQVLVSGDTDDEVRASLQKILLPSLHAEKGLLDFRIASASGDLYLSDVPASIQSSILAGTYQRSTFARPKDAESRNAGTMGVAFVADDNLRLPAGRDYIVDDSLWLTVSRLRDDGTQTNDALSVSILTVSSGANIAVFDHGAEMDSPRLESTVHWPSTQS